MENIKKWCVENCVCTLFNTQHFLNPVKSCHVVLLYTLKGYGFQTDSNIWELGAVLWWNEKKKTIMTCDPFCGHISCHGVQDTLITSKPCSKYSVAYFITWFCRARSQLIIRQRGLFSFLSSLRSNQPIIKRFKQNIRIEYLIRSSKISL